MFFPKFGEDEPNLTSIFFQMRCFNHQPEYGKPRWPRYDPSTDGHHCGWSGPDHSDGESRCGAAGDSGTYRPLAELTKCEFALIHRENGGASWYGTLNNQPHYYTIIVVCIGYIIFQYPRRDALGCSKEEFLVESPP